MAMQVEEQLEHYAELFTLMATAMGLTEAQLETLPHLLLKCQAPGSIYAMDVQELVDALKNVQCLVAHTDGATSSAVVRPPVSLEEQLLGNVGPVVCWCYCNK